jgi:hypothetical protein
MFLSDGKRSKMRRGPTSLRGLGLTAGIAHEIKNPLNFVNNFAGLSVELLDELKDTTAPAINALGDEKRAEIDETITMLTGNLCGLKIAPPERVRG